MMHPAPLRPASEATPVSLFARAARRLRAGAPAVHDALLLAYMVIVVGLLWATAPASGPPPVIHQVYASIAILLGASFFARALPEIPRFVRINVYRIGIVGIVIWSYLMLRDVLPAIRTDAVDSTLHAIDGKIFHGEPILWLERLNHRPIIEWLSFFYFSYYALHLAFIIGVLWIARQGRLTAEYAIGIVLVIGLGQLLYMAVPGFGPVVFLADRFHAPLDGGFFWRVVAGSVESAGAQKDVFPSLHTAGPTWMAILSVRQARIQKAWRLPAAITCFFAVNIVVSTMVLRWHYVIDVIAGLTLASFAAFAAAKLARWEEAERSARDLPPVWTFK
jgi:membrane-associated phospholipid phosphatase